MIETVLGPIPAESLGATSMHEHLLSDSSTLLRPAREPMPADERVTIENLGFVRWNYLALLDNLILDDPDAAAQELAHAASLGQGAVVELTSWGMGPRHSELPAISRASGIHVVAGYGTYLGKSLPDWIRDLDEAALEEHLYAALTDEIPGAGFRAGVLGLLGTSAELDPLEVMGLRASARAAARAGASVSIRLDPAARLGPQVLDLITKAGLAADRVVFCNVDEFMDATYLGDLAAAGATLEIGFGNEAYYHDRYKDATDAERIRFLLGLLESGVTSIVLAASVWSKGQLATFGGMGYGHVIGRIVPVLLRAGVSQEQVDDMLITRPRTVLDRPAT